MLNGIQELYIFDLNHIQENLVMQNLRYRHDELTCITERSGFYSEGTWCAASLHRPAQTDIPALPAVLMVHGWGGIQNALTTPFYEEFTRAGFAVMTFDYRGWGDSAGLPRNAINPWHRVRDADAALAHLKCQPAVDPARIVLWGTSFGGGHVVELAAEHPELMGAVAQVPMLDGMAAVKAVPFKRLLKFGLYGLVDSLKPGRPIYIPVVSEPDAFSTMDRDSAGEALKRASENIGRQYDNRVAARSLMTMGPYRPFRRLQDIRIPTLLIGASRDTVAPFVEKAIRKVDNPHLTLDTLDANHFEPYFEPVFSSLIEKEVRFIRSLL